VFNKEEQYVIEHAVSFLTGMIGIVVGAAGAFFTLKQKVEDWIKTTNLMVDNVKKDILAVKEDLDKIRDNVEHESVSIGECKNCKAQWASSIENYQRQSALEAVAVKELAKSEMNTINVKLNGMAANQNRIEDEVKNAVDRLYEVLIHLGVKPGRRRGDIPGG
jgi:hypothetical protein